MLNGPRNRGRATAKLLTTSAAITAPQAALAAAQIKVISAATRRMSDSLGGQAKRVGSFIPRDYHPRKPRRRGVGNARATQHPDTPAEDTSVLAAESGA